MLLRMLTAVGVKEVEIAGMDGYSEASAVYYDSEWEYDFSKEAIQRNAAISEELRDISRYLKIQFITPTVYTI